MSRKQKPQSSLKTNYSNWLNNGTSGWNTTFLQESQKEKGQMYLCSSHFHMNYVLQESH
jgi:hypothetical protein